MKTRLLFLVAVALIVATNVVAIDLPKMNVVRISDSKTLVAASQEAPAVHQMSIIDERGQVVYYKESKEELPGYKQVFNFSHLDDGAYEIKFKAGRTTLTRSMNVENGLIKAEPQKIEYDPVFALNENTLKVSYLNFEKENVRLKVFNDQDLIYKSELGDEFVLQHGYDLSKLSKGKYNIVLASTNDEYWFSVTK